MKRLQIKRLAALTLALAFTGSSVTAQSLMRISAESGETADERIPVGHVTDVLNERTDARRALESFHEGRRMGLGAAGKSSTRYQIGETREFLVHTSVTDGSRDKKTFELKGQSAVANIWVQVGELANGHVQNSSLEALGGALLSTTPEGSFNPSQGIIANDNAVFGDPPNVDGDGVVDVLLYDIPDENSGSVLAGFVWSGDMCTTQNAATRGCSAQISNQADVLYLDTDPLLTSYPLETLLEVAAHEYQHLIHFGFDLNEETFLNEGLSEWAERMNGYRGRTISYLATEVERNKSLFTWRETSGDVLTDYQRASLFTTYLAERVGILAAGSLARRTEVGVTAYRAVLAESGLTLEDLLLDFHTANLLNDSSVGGSSRFAYTNPHLRDLRGPVSEARLFDGRSGTDTPDQTATVNGGGSVYLAWEFVNDLALSVDLVNASALDYGRARARAILKDFNGGVTVQDFTPGSVPRTFPGEYEEVLVVITHVKPVSAAAIGVEVDRINVTYSAAWDGGEQVESEILRYDDGTATDGLYFVLDASGAGALATRFTRPNNDATLGRIYLAPYFLNQFGNGGQPPEAARNIEVRIWADDGAGAPGEVLFSKAIPDPRQYFAITSSDLQFFDLDLSREPLPPLPASIYIGYAETGTDQNHLVVGLDDYEAENVSFVWDSEAGSWLAVWDMKLSSLPDPLIGKAIPIRAEYRTGISVAGEEPADLPIGVSLEQNYPNPFNPVTSIAYSLPSAERVRLTVFDVTGREVARLVEGHVPAGDHRVQFDGANLGSGVYLYVLETGAERIARKMLLVK